ncbi:MAG: hypothetical protein M3R35_02610 [Candidatus Eremiobacteraeota bacterium]|nr:hypothetical protein [Candidatus Eremiobacteraeota bacterium]
MERRRIAKALGWACALVFLIFAVYSSDYAPGFRSVANVHAVRSGVEAVQDALPNRAIDTAFILRKLYSIVAFSIVGLLVAASAGRSRPQARLARCAFAVGLLSVCIELLQALKTPHEGLHSNAFDVACGMIGGVIGYLLWSAGTALARR